MASRRIQVVCLGGAALALAGVLAFADPQPAHAQKEKESQAQSNEQLFKALNVLHTTKLILEGADHDYGGHRAEAVKSIGAAQHQLRLALGLKGGGKGEKKVKGGHEPQVISNLQLAEAIPVLKQTVTVLKEANHDYNGHRANAVRDLHEAVHQLEAALKYEKKKEGGRP
jgi:hypothetical protein